MDIPPSTPTPVLALDMVERGKRDLAKHEQRLAALREQVMRTEEECARLRAFLVTSAAYLNIVSASAAPIHDKAPTQATVLLDATVAELRAQGRPMTIGELFTRMLELGHRITGKNPKQNFSWILSNAGKGRVKYEIGKGWCVDTDPAQPPPTESELIALGAAP